MPTCSFAVPVALTSYCQKYLEMVVPYHTNKFCRYGIILPTIPPYHCALWDILYVWWHIARFRRMPLVGTGSRKQNSRYGSMVVMLVHGLLPTMVVPSLRHGRASPNELTTPWSLLTIRTHTNITKVPYHTRLSEECLFIIHACM